MDQETIDSLREAFMAGMDAGLEFASDRLRGYHISGQDEEEAFEAFLIGK